MRMSELTESEDPTHGMSKPINAEKKAIINIAKSMYTISEKIVCMKLIIYFYPKNEIKIIPNSITLAPRNRWRRFFSRKNHPPRTTAKRADADLNALV